MLNRFRKRLTPKQRALRAFDQLLESGSGGNSDPKFVYEKTTQILRTFIESQFDFPATRQTTEEFLAAVKVDRRLGDGLQQRLKRFLDSADMVKFAGLFCNESDLADAINKARQFVLQADEQRIASAKQERVESRTQRQQTNDKFAVPLSGGITAEAGTTNNYNNSSSLQKETV